MRSKSSPPLQSSINRNTDSLSSFVSYRRTMLGWSSFRNVSISLLKVSGLWSTLFKTLQA